MCWTGACKTLGFCLYHCFEGVPSQSALLLQIASYGLELVV
jgi:hypothetical protein